MSTQKLFKCTLLNPGFTCDFTAQGEQDPVVDQAVNHEINEHGFEDTPELRKNIENSLIDVNGA